MRLKLQAEHVAELRTALRRAGNQESGGQLFGEQLAPSSFLVTRLTIQRRRGTIASFFVDLFQATRDAARFFEATDHQYRRYNYIGEWHSHPRFAVEPSAVDVATMEKLVSDPDFRGHFAILMITRLSGAKVDFGAWLFERNASRVPVQLDLPA